MTTTTTPEAVREFLASLGGTAEDVAASLGPGGLKITGRRASGGDCPIARALRARFPGSWWVSSEEWSHGDPNGAYCFGLMPLGVHAFIRAVDHGSPYPHLVEPWLCRYGGSDV